MLTSQHLQSVLKVYIKYVSMYCICKNNSPWYAFESSSICLEPAYLHRCSQGMTLVSGVSWGIALEWWECFLSSSGGCTQSAYWCFLFFHMVAHLPRTLPLLCTECKTVERSPWFMTFSPKVVHFVFISILHCCSLLSGNILTPQPSTPLCG